MVDSTLCKSNDHISVEDTVAPVFDVIITTPEPEPEGAFTITVEFVKETMLVEMKPAK